MSDQNQAADKAAEQARRLAEQRERIQQAMRKEVEKFDAIVVAAAKADNKPKK